MTFYCCSSSVVVDPWHRDGVDLLMPVLGAEAAAACITRRGRATPRGPLEGGGVIGPVTNPAQTVSDLGALSIRLSSQTPARRQAQAPPGR